MGDRADMLRLRHAVWWMALICWAAGLAACAQDSAVRDKRVKALRDMGNAMATEGNLRGALGKLLEAVKIDPDKVELNHEIAILLRNLGQYELSLKYFQRTLSLDPKFSEASENLGTLYLLMERWDSAIDCFQKALADLLYKTPHYAYNNMGWAYYRKGDYDRAIQSFQQAIRLSRSYAVAYANLARTRQAKGELDKAVEAYNQAVYYAPRDAGAHLELAKVLLKQGKMEEAKEELNLAVSADPISRAANEARKLLKNVVKK